MYEGQLIALTIACLLSTSGCGSQGNCANLCQREASFDFASPPAGTNFQFMLEPGDLSASCIVTSPGTLRCDPSGPLSRVIVGGPNGNQLQTVVWHEPPTGALGIAVTVDGVTAPSQSFVYEPKQKSGTCGEGCYEDPHFSIE